MARKSKLKFVYGLSMEEYDAKLENQNGKCANHGCSATKTKRGYRLNVDHDHVTGDLRGLLCDDCNLALGFMNEDIGKLSGLISYLKAWRK